MAGYKKGLETKDTIIGEAKKLFYINGYKKVSIANICKNSNTKLGTLTYYFKRKEDILSYLYNDYMSRIFEIINTRTDNLDEASKHIHMILLYYFNIYRDQNIIRFHREVLNTLSMYDILYNQEITIKPFADASILAKDPSMFKLLIMADNAVRREINLKAASDGYTRDVYEIKEIIIKIYTVTAQLFSYDLDILYKKIDEAFEFLISNIDQRVDLL